MYSLEKLKVYDRALAMASVANLAQLSANWDKRHAVVEQLVRASESVVLNLAEGARLRGSPQRQQWFHALPGGAELSSRWFRQIDKAVTSVVLNIAEGNGRRIEADHRQFLELAESSVMKVGTYIQLCRRTEEIDAESEQRGLLLLDEAALLVRGLAQST